MIEIDGSHGEGGGAILRNAIALSAAFGEPARVFNIRKGRKEPGLKLQHLTAVKALQEIAGAKVRGAEKGSQEISFGPGKIAGGKHRFDIGSAGSVTLVLQALMPALAFAEKETELEIVGGTHVNWSPPFEYLKEVLLPQLRKMGYRCEVELLRHGFYPKGGGIVRAEIEPCGRLNPLKLAGRGELAGIEGVSISANLPEHIAKRQAHAAAAALVKAGHESRIGTRVAQADCPGTAIALWAKYSSGAILGAGSLGEIGKKAEKVGEEAAGKLLKEMESGAAVDEHLADQLLVYMALAEGRSEILASRLTGHAKTNAWLIGHFIKNRFEIEEKPGGTARIAMEGAGHGA